jgi:hypothetical protein
MLLLDQPATLFWAEGMRKEAGGKLLPDSKRKDFETVKDAVCFAMETLSEGSRPTAQIETLATPLHYADIEKLYAGIKSA